MAMCYQCHENEAKPGKKTCQACLTRIALSNRKRRIERQSAGLCGICGGVNPDPRYANCSSCRQRVKRYNDARKARLMATGLCGICGKPDKSGYGRCPDCQAEARERQAAKRKVYPETLARERDGQACQLCGDGNKLSAHHIDCQGRDQGRNPTPNHNLDNLITLCHGCHMLVHRTAERPIDDKHLFKYLVKRCRESTQV